MKRYQLTAADAVQAPRVCNLGFSDNIRVTRYGPSVRNQYIIHYVLSGKGIFNGREVGKGKGFLITPGLYEEYYPDPKDPWSFLWIISEDASMQYFFDRHNADAETGIFAFHAPYELEDTVRQIKENAGSLLSCAQLTELFLRIFHTCVENKDRRESSLAKTYFAFSVNHIKANLHLKLSVEELCRAIGITQPYLYRIFKQEAGCSPKQYISDCKLTQAKRLLTQTELSISLIADSVGFESVLAFSKFFSKQTFLSPTAYRNTYR